MAVDAVAGAVHGAHTHVIQEGMSAVLGAWPVARYAEGVLRVCVYVGGLCGVQCIMHISTDKVAHDAVHCTTPHHVYIGIPITSHHHQHSTHHSPTQPPRLRDAIPATLEDVFTQLATADGHNPYTDDTTPLDIATRYHIVQSHVILADEYCDALLTKHLQQWVAGVVGTEGGGAGVFCKILLDWLS